MILVTGAKGMMGSYVATAFKGEPLCLTGRDRFDVCDLAQGDALFQEIQPRLVIHLAAETDVDHCEKYPDHAFRIAIVGAQNVSRLAVKYNAEVLYVSTSGVFDGRKAGLYTEFDDALPVTVYGKAKLEAENVVRQLCPRSYILRAGWVFGGGCERDKKFVGKMIQMMTDKPEVSVVDDKKGSPTYALDFMQNAAVVAGSGYYGLYHLVNHGAATRYEIALELKKILGLPTKVLPVTSAMFPLPAFRPPNDSVRNYRLQLLGLDKMRSWQEALADYVSDWTLATRESKMVAAQAT